MIPSSFCDACGAALPVAATTCPVCGEALQTSSRAYFAQTTPVNNNLSMQRYSVLMQRYRILEKIGEGGFGHVYKASDKKDNKIVAIKQINLAALSMQEMIDVTDSYNREITLLPTLLHRNLPHIYDHFTDADHWYIVMEYINGKTLEEMLTKTNGGRLPIKQVLDIGMVLCDVLAYLHDQQPAIIFRDVKPANIMITDKGDIYLIDFGIARRYRAEQSRDTGSPGSLGYAAPEQYGKAQTTPRTDIYGLGATLQTLLTGKEPLEIATAGIPLDCDIPTELQRLITHMMNRDMRKRPYNMVEVRMLLMDIKKHLTGLQGWFISPFAWLATLWGLFILLIASIFLSSLSFQIWTLYFLAALCTTISMDIYYCYKAMKTIPGKPTSKETRAIINEGLIRPLYVICLLLVIGCFYSLLPTLFPPLEGGKSIILISFLCISISVMLGILKGLPLLTRWLKQRRAKRRVQQAAPIAPLQQQMH